MGITSQLKRGSTESTTAPLLSGHVLPHNYSSSAGGSKAVLATRGQKPNNPLKIMWSNMYLLKHVLKRTGHNDHNELQQ